MGKVGGSIFRTLYRVSIPIGGETNNSARSRQLSRVSGDLASIQLFGSVWRANKSGKWRLSQEWKSVMRYLKKHEAHWTYNIAFVLSNRPAWPLLGWEYNFLAVLFDGFEYLFRRRSFTARFWLRSINLLRNSVTAVFACGLANGVLRRELLAFSAASLQFVVNTSVVVN